MEKYMSLDLLKNIQRRIVDLFVNSMEVRKIINGRVFPLILILLFISTATAFGQISRVGNVMNANGGNVQSLSVAKPTGATIGDVLVMTVIRHVTGNTENSWVNESAGSSWTTLVTGGLSGDNNYRLTVLYKVISVDWEPTSYTVIPTANWYPNATYMQVSLMAYRGINSSNPINVFSSLATSAGTGGSTISVNSITPTVSNSLMLMLAGSYRNTDTSRTYSSWTTATSGTLTEFHDNAGTARTSVGAASLALSTATASGTGTVTLSGNGTYRGAVLLALAPATITTSAITGSSFCSGASVSVPFTKAGTFALGNVFTAQLSNASGSFASPINIGTLTSTAAGTIAATIPANTSTGTGYRIRVVSSNPSVTGSDNGINLSIFSTPSTPTTVGASICIGTVAGTVLTASGAATGEVYKWYSAASAGTLLKTSTDNNDNTYTTPVLSVTTNYWVSVQNAGGCESARTQVTATYPTVSTASQTLAGTDTWIGHVYDGTNFNSYYGTMNSSDLPTITFDHNFGAAATCFPFNNGGSPRSIQTETFSIRYRMNSTLKGLFAVELGSDDGSRLTIDGLKIYDNWVDQGFTFRSNVLIRLSGSSPLLYEFYENGGENRVVFQNLNRIIENTLTQNTSQSIPLGATGSAISGDVFGALPSGIGLSGTGYQWEYSTTPGGSRTVIAGATSATYTPSSAVAPFNTPGTYYLYRDAILTSSNNTGVNPYVSSLISNGSTVTVLQPTVSTSTASLSGFSYLVNNGPSAQQSFTVSGANLISDVTITPPANYEISTTSGSGFQSTPILLTPASGAVSATIYTRLKSGLVSGSYGGNVVVSATSATSANVSLSGSVTMPTYCAMAGNISYPTSITSVVFNTINQVSAKPGAYSDYTAVSTNVVLGTSQNLSVRVNTDGNYTCNARAWIDWNADGDFADAGELYELGSATNQSNGLVSLSPLAITIPTTAIVGQTRMRVAMMWPDLPTLCTTGFDGEVEDYTINIQAPSIATGTIASSVLLAGSTVSVPFTVTGAFRAANVFTAQLSDATGSFASPVNIGSLTSVTSGTINAVIPVNSVSASAYRIRVVASSPAVTGSDNTVNLSIVNGTYASATNLSGFTYKQNLGPSNVLSATFGGTFLTSNIRLESVSGNFEFSTSNSPFSGSSVVILPVVNGSVALTPVYVRLKAGLNIGSYTDSIRVTSTGFEAKFVSLSGTVTSSPNVTVAPTSLALGGYNFGGGPTAAQNFTVRASRLSGAVTITPPAGFELKLSSVSTYQSTALTINPDFPASNSDSLLIKTINVRMKGGLGSGVHSGDITIGASGATTRTVAVSGTVNAKASILNSTSFLGAFIYTLNAGPSRVQGFQLKVNDLAAASTITITPPTTANYEISRTRTGTYQTTAITISNVSGNFTDSVFVRLKSGLVVGNYGPQGVIITATGAVTKSVACVGKVVNAATLSTSTSTITGFGYQQANAINPPGISNNGPSNTQTFVLSGTSLNNDATITAPDNFEISFSPTSGFATTITAVRASGIIAPRNVYVRLKSGLGVGSFTGNVNISSAGATSLQVALASAKVYASPLVSASGGGDYCLGSTINLSSTGGSELANRFWEGPNSFYSINPSPVLSTNATAALNGDYVVTANVMVGGNLVYNGNFEQGNVGFGSAYGYPTLPFSTNSLVPEGLYAITTTGSVVHYNFNTNPDHTADPSNLQMIINGNTSAGAVVWSQNVSVLPGSDYQFTYWLQTVINGTDKAPSKLQLYINGVAAGPVYTANPTSGVWTQYIYNTNSGSSSSLNLELINQTIIAGGNDFALDDIELTQVLYAKDTVTVAVGSALPVSVSVVASQTNVAPNVPVTFTATPTNGGTAPIYKWVVGSDTLQSSSSPTFTRSFTTTTTVKCILVSSLNCVTGNPASTNTTVTVTALPNPNYWFGILDTDWAKAANWTDNRVPNPGEDVEYATVANYGLAAKKDLYVDDVRIVGNIINATNRKLVIPAGKQLIVNNNISFSYGVNRDSLIEVRATTPLVGGLPGAANGTLIFNNAQNNPVSATVQMYSPATWDLSKPVNHKYNWQFFGIPVSSLVAVPTFKGAYVRELIESDKDTATHWRSLTDNSVLIPFKGYELCQNTTKIYTFKGQLVNSNYNSGQLVKTVGALYPGQHLLANPYTCAIDIKFIEFGSGVEATAYLYNTGSFNSWKLNPIKNDQGLTIVPGQYNSVPKNQAGNFGLFGQIPSMGTFMVRIPKSSPSTSQSYVAINYAAVAAKNTDRQRAEEYSVTKEQSSTLISVEGESGADKVWLMSHETYTRDFDNGYDGRKLAGLALNPQIYALEKDTKYQINAVENINNTSLAFQAGIDTKYTAIIKNNPMVLHKYRKMYLHDLIDNNIVDILADSTAYQFTANTSVDPIIRFKILAQKYEDDTQNEIHTQVYRLNNTIRVQNFSKFVGRVYLYDITGRVIDSRELNAEENIGIPVYDKSAYVVKVVVANKTETTKLILE